MHLLNSARFPLTHALVARVWQGYTRHVRFTAYEIARRARLGIPDPFGVLTPAVPSAGACTERANSKGSGA